MSKTDISQNNFLKFDLYRFFFPVGWLFGFWGAFLWILFAFKFIEYPGVPHPEIMTGGFLLAFISGFITTATPKFTDSFPPTVKDFRIFLIITTLQFISLTSANLMYFRLCALMQLIYLSWFVGMRFYYRKSNPPEVFMFISFGLLMGIVGVLLLLTGWSVELGRLFFLQGYILSFVLGIGSRLIPALTGNHPRNFKLQSIIIMGVILVLSYLLEVYLSPLIGTSLRNILILYIAFTAWNIHHLPVRRGYQSWGIWNACWSIIIGSIGVSFFPADRIHLLHLVFVSGLSLLTIMIATRVTLSHGKYNMAPEMNSRYLQISIGLIILAGLTRSSAGFLPRLYESHLTYAALVWIIGLIIWGIFFIPKILKQFNNN